MSKKPQDITSFLHTDSKVDDSFETYPSDHSEVYDSEAFEEERRRMRFTSSSLSNKPQEIESSLSLIFRKALEFDPDDIESEQEHANPNPNFDEDIPSQSLSTKHNGSLELPRKPQNHTLSSHFYRHQLNKQIVKQESNAPSQPRLFHPEYVGIDTETPDSCDRYFEVDSDDEENTQDGLTAQDDRLLAAWRIHNNANIVDQDGGWLTISQSPNQSQVINPYTAEDFRNLLPIIGVDEEEVSLKSDEKLSANKILFFLKKLSDESKAKKINLGVNFATDQELHSNQLAVDDENLKTSCFASCFARLCYRQKKVSEEYLGNLTADFVIPKRTSGSGFLYQNKIFIFEDFNDQELLDEADFKDEQSFQSAIEEYLKSDDQDQRLKIINVSELEANSEISQQLKQNILSQIYSPQASPRRVALSIERDRFSETSSNSWIEL